MGIENTFNSKPDYVDLINLVRSVQRAEGNIDCYRRGRQQCDRMNCVWRDHCLKALDGFSKVFRESYEQKNSESDAGTRRPTRKTGLERFMTK